MIRTAALISILLSELLLLAILVLDISASSLNLISTMVVVVICAFGCSALLRNIRSMKLSRNYMVSGIIGIILGVIYFLWAADNLESMVQWLKETGIYFLLLLIFLCALFLFFNKGHSKNQTENSLNETA